MLQSFKRTIIDIETNGLLNDMINFTSMPFKLKASAKLWLIVLTDKDNTSNSIKLTTEDCTKDNLKDALEHTEEIIFHNGIKFDLVALRLFGVLDYEIYFDIKDGKYNGSVFKKPVKITDTLVLSKLLNADRWFGHSLSAWGKQLGDYKTDYRQVCIDKGYIDKNAKPGEEFSIFTEELIPYCIQDTKVTASVYDELMIEKGHFDIDMAYQMELKICDLTIKQEFYGFKFDTLLAKKSVLDLNEKLETIANKVNPILPPKKLNKGEQKDFLPPVRQYKANGDISAFLEKFIVKIGATLSEDKTELYFEGNTFQLPLEPNICLKTTIESDIDDLDHLKSYLIDIGWIPLEWKERDLTKDSKKKKLDSEKLVATIKRYVDNTLNGVFKEARLNILGIPEDLLLTTLLDRKNDFSLKVPVSPSIRIGTEKKLCPNLEDLGDKAEFVSDVVKYLTFKHRRNSIAGGTEDEDGEPTTGFLSLVRDDGRVSTPADTLGANGKYNIEK